MIESIPQSITDCFYFLNHNFYARTHPRRRILARRFNMKLLQVKVMCAQCGKTILKSNAKRCAIPYLVRRCDPQYQLIRNITSESGRIQNRNLVSYYCSDCYEERVKKERFLMSAKSYELTEKFSDLLATCEKMGTCDVLSVHHELLKDDPERLTTEFLLDMICNRRENNDKTA